jgi:hypothetical protein
VKTSAALIYFVLLLSLGIKSYSQTPDGMTPAEEDSCGGLKGSAFGLCNAFCEAKDCDSIDPMDWNNSCFKLLDNYEKKTGNPGPPCFCGGPSGACQLDFQDCLANCDPADPAYDCCKTACKNARSKCDTQCCVQQANIELNICIENCNGDTDCEHMCPHSFCISSIETCAITGH